jgi:transposase
VQLLTTLLASIADLDQAMGKRLAKHPKARLLAGLPRVGPGQPWSTAGWSDPGPSPQRRARHRPGRRRTGDHRLRHPQAVRILGHAWLRVIWACWHTNTAYDPAKHPAEQRLAG